MSVNEALYFTFRPSIVNVDDRYVVPLRNPVVVYEHTEEGSRDAVRQ